MTSDEIRERYLSFFAERDHLVLPSASLVPRNDPSTLLISAGMHPLKPYFAGIEKPRVLRYRPPGLLSALSSALSHPSTEAKLVEALGLDPTPRLEYLYTVR